MHELSNIGAAPPHELEPCPRDRAEFTWLRVEPFIDGRNVFDCSGESQKCGHEQA
jgi:hypothetical protein